MADVFPEVGQVVLTSLLSLAAMFIFTRAGGKRQIAQMSPFDYLTPLRWVPSAQSWRRILSSGGGPSLRLWSMGW